MKEIIVLNDDQSNYLVDRLSKFRLMVNGLASDEKLTHRKFIDGIITQIEFIKKIEKSVKNTNPDLDNVELWVEVHHFLAWDDGYEITAEILNEVNQLYKIYCNDD